jgi:hypothetical protein
MTSYHDRKHSPDQSSEPASAAAEKAPGRRPLTAEVTDAASPGPRAAARSSEAGSIRPAIQLRRAADGSAASHAGGRDASGVTSDARDHVDRAADSSGSPLPTDLRTHFESSLGKDLSGVRLHTGTASVAAAHAVGAKAYTVGQNVHFGKGHYDPVSHEGKLLLAHEVAHTVQQGSAASGRSPQFKLDVTQAGDALEVEADRAADSMVAGRPFDLSSTRATVARAPSNKETIDSGNEAYNESREDSGGVHHLELAYAGSRSQAQSILKQIKAGTESLRECQLDSPNADSGERIGANETAESAVDRYLQEAGTQDTMQGAFGPLAIECQADYARLMGMYRGARASLGITSTQDNLNETAALEMGSGKGKVDPKNKADVEKNTQKEFSQQQTPIDPAMAGRVNNLQSSIGDLAGEIRSEGRKVAKEGQTIKSSLDELNVAESFAELPPPEFQEDDDQEAFQAQVDNAKAQMKQVQAAIGVVVNVASTGLGSIGSKAGDFEVDNFTKVSLKGDAGDVEKLKEIQGLIDKNTGLIPTEQNNATSAGFTDGLADALTGCSKTVSSANAAITAITEAHTREYLATHMRNVDNKTKAAQNAATSMRKAKINQKLAEAKMRATVKELSTLIKGNTKGEGTADFSVALAFQSEATIYLSHVESAIAVGVKERDAAEKLNANVKQGSGEKKGSAGITNSSNSNAAMSFYSAYKTPTEAVHKGYVWGFTASQVVIKGNDQEAADKTMDGIVEQLKSDEKDVNGFIDELGKLTGIVY